MDENNILEELENRINSTMDSAVRSANYDQHISFSLKECIKIRDFIIILQDKITLNKEDLL